MCPVQNVVSQEGGHEIGVALDGGYHGRISKEFLEGGVTGGEEGDVLNAAECPDQLRVGVEQLVEDAQSVVLRGEDVGQALCHGRLGRCQRQEGLELHYGGLRRE